jgi:glucosamine 6-phosphate synthetase-like amidotransferase/phosphosugar isomerase protein
MCGIFGVINYGGKRTTPDLRQITNVIKCLLNASEVRGKDASGICVVTGGKAKVYKERIPGSKLPDEVEYKSIMEINYQDNFQYMFGHTRHKTKGSEYLNVNNHPIIVDKVIGIHNGVISNDDALFQLSPELQRHGQVDSEVIFQLINKHMNKMPDLIESVKKTCVSLVGYYHCAFLHTDYKEYLTLFTGPDIAIVNNKAKKIMAFASSQYILTKAIQGFELFKESSEPIQVKDKAGCRINTTNGKIHFFAVNDYASEQQWS